LSSDFYGIIEIEVCQWAVNNFELHVTSYGYTMMADVRSA
jgi:hypothetical protein